MFIGHFAAGFALKKAAPRTSLGELFAAALLPDLLWPVFLLLGWETVRIAPGDTAFTPLEFVSYPISHSLLAVLLWGLLFALLYWLRRGYRLGGIAILLGAASHWILDALSHRADVPLYPGGPRVGLGLWNSVPATLLVEVSLFAAGVWLYARTTRARDRGGKYGLAALVAFLGLLYLANLGTEAPPSASAVAWVSLAGFLFPLAAWWIDRHRTPAALDPAIARRCNDT